MRFGTEVREDEVAFRIFGPAIEHMRLQLDESKELLDLSRTEDGWHELVSAGAHAGSRYRYVLPDGLKIPDPASRFQPEDVAGPSEVIDPCGFGWSDSTWKGRPWSDAVLYELHIGTLTSEGTFLAAIEKLDHLAALGVTAIELMTIADFPGLRGWGYDSVLPFAPDSAYGRPEDLKAFIDAAHARGLMVLLDVVYNHFGPEGNYLSRYFPQICSSKHDTAWGKSMNFDGEGSAEVRSFFLENALYWIDEFHVDGLRIDASHAMVDTSPRHILDELAERVHAFAGDREVHLILEDEENVSARLMRAADGSVPGFTAQWNHDMTHLLSAAMGNLCPDRDSNAEETGNTARMLAEGYVLAPSAKNHPEDVRCKVPPTAYIAFLQTHDLIGNRIAAERLDRLTSHDALRAVTAILLLLPQTPMLFMGQEWAASNPFPFFCDYHGELSEKIRNGRCEFLERLHNTKELQASLDPGAESTFRIAQLDWMELAQDWHAAELRWFQQMLAVRREELAPVMRGLKDRCGHPSVLGPGAFAVRWHLSESCSLHLAANLCGQHTAGFAPAAGKVLWLEGMQTAEDQLGPWCVRWTLE